MTAAQREQALDALQVRLARCQSEIAGPTTPADRRRIERELRAITCELKAIPPLPPYRGGILPEHREAILWATTARNANGATCAINTTTAGQ